MKFIICLLSVILFSSCMSHSSDSSNMNIREFTYHGHTYIEFKPKFSYGSTVIHDPNCNCYDKHM